MLKQRLRVAASGASRGIQGAAQSCVIAFIALVLLFGPFTGVAGQRTELSPLTSPVSSSPSPTATRTSSPSPTVTRTRSPSPTVTSTRSPSPTASPSPVCRPEDLDFTASPLSASFEQGLWVYFNFTSRAYSGPASQAGSSTILPCAIRSVTIGATVCSLANLNWTASYHFKCSITPPESADTLLYPMPISVTLVEPQPSRTINPSQSKLNTFSWVRAQTRLQMNVTNFNQSAFTFSARVALLTALSQFTDGSVYMFRIGAVTAQSIIVNVWDSLSARLPELRDNRLSLIRSTGLNITSMAVIGSGFDSMCDPPCLNDGQCFENTTTKATSCVCAPGYNGSDCSDLRVQDRARRPDRGYLASAADVPNMAMSATSGNSSMTVSMSWSSFATSQGQSYDLDATRLSQSLDSRTEDGVTVFSFQSSFNGGSTTSSTSFSVSSDSRQTMFAGHTLTIPAGAVKNGMEFLGPPPFTLNSGENIVVQLALDLGSASVVSSSSPTGSGHLYSIKMTLSNGFEVDLRYLDQALIDDVVVDITVEFNTTTKSLIITTAPWTSTWSYDPDFNVLVGSDQSSDDDFPLAAVAGGSVGGAVLFVAIVLIVAGVIIYRAKRNSNYKPKHSMVNFNADDGAASTAAARQGSELFATGAPLSSRSKKQREESKQAAFAKNKQSVWEGLIDANSPPSSPSREDEMEASTEMEDVSKH